MGEKKKSIKWKYAPYNKKFLDAIHEEVAKLFERDRKNQEEG